MLYLPYSLLEQQALSCPVEIISDLQRSAQVGPKDRALSVHDQEYQLSFGLAHIEESGKHELPGVGGAVAVSLVQQFPALLQDIRRDELLELVRDCYLFGHRLRHKVRAINVLLV